MPQPLVLLPGLLNTRRLYESQIADLADLAEVIVPELWHYDSIGAMAQAALDAAPERFALGGFSMGGYVSFEILRRDSLFYFPKQLKWLRSVEPYLSGLPLGGQYQVLCRKPRIEMIPGNALAQDFIEQADVLFEANVLADFE